jgi:isochorismate pyruvate lyase
MPAIRAAIDDLDGRLVSLLAERQRLVEQAIAVKTRDGLPARIPIRIDEVIANVERHATEKGLDPTLANILWSHMIEWFVAFEDRHLQQ